MRNLRAVAATLKPLFENPELGAMAEICEILQALPDDAARMRVMRWSFARFGGEEFKRIVPTLPALPAHADVPAALTAVAPYEREVAEEMPVVDVEAISDTEDLAGQISELQDLFSGRPVAVKKLRSV
jgi:hypothetical protein